ncbi:hypothetical protein ASPWEDRAFT_51534 [Aspergillus wentii DTO 134E9]|uniref:SH3 domain-containing protein n=1 Tax=Aspergillus wentii DTO 134E9 TaxID=1073089 RepID=A0A1L9RKU1_ASPWE|nr:uncharacterized protein ASPWEDRAFT_51534 [Aspergillus wentii DTO 134E9]OJJ35503.1 hypothetical protein ASPWEDRAFT_51534 [Aspergillus wentii DTO 134E9]
MSSTSPPPEQSASHLSALPPILTDGTVKRPTCQRSSSYAKDRLSTYSNVSCASQNRSRPGSHVFPVFHTSLPYALVRDFAYPAIHPLHYGPLPPRASAVSTPASEHRRLSDPPAPWDSSRGQWSTGPWSTENSYGHQQLPAMSFGDGPPYSEDEDLHSPVFTAPRHRKNKSTGTDLNLNGRRNKARSIAPPGYFTPEVDRGTLVSMNADGSETYYVNDEDAMEDGPGGELVTYSADESRFSHMAPESYDNQQGYEQDPGFESEDEFTGDRYSRDFQFAVGCPDEEMNGKAVALFDFTREHENELPLTEGQVIFVSYRHGQGWLVAEDPKTGESGLVPEEFVRLLRDIEGGLTSLNGDPNADMTGNNTHLSPESTESDQVSTPTQNDQLPLGSNGNSAHSVNGETRDNDHPVVVSSGGDESNSNTSHLPHSQNEWEKYHRFDENMIPVSLIS